MRIIRADVLGMCFGVRDALAVIDGVDQPEQVTIHGELVHNEQVLAHLEARGFQQADETSRRELPLTGTVLITAHGVSQTERRRLENAGAIITTTESAVFEWIGAAGSPQFKEISRLVQERMKQIEDRR